METLLLLIDPTNPVGLFFLGFIGQVAHQLKKWIRDDEDTGIIEFFTSYPKHTVAAVIATVLAVYALSQIVPIPSIGETIFAGFVADSTLNKSPNSGDYAKPPTQRSPNSVDHYADTVEGYIEDYEESYVSRVSPNSAIS